ncbi:MAG: discoidin domain-containing protein, partial [Spirochaetaceae bacterium]|nr:discoidin domain-containing protein [Spirochaetaceae bacterium]
AKGPGLEQDYEVDRWVALIRRLQPDAAIFSESGPDIRWIGNEEGVAGETNWSKMPPHRGISGNDTALLGSGVPEGSRWLVGECDVSIRPGWFHHPEEDAKVKTPASLLDLYLKSVGRNAVLLLNVPPTHEGLIAEPDVSTLQGFGHLLWASFSDDLAAGSKASASSTWMENPAFGPENVLDDEAGRYWAAGAGERSAWIVLDFPGTRSVDAIRVEEYIELGQRISAFHVEVLRGGSWTKVAGGTTIGFKRILCFAPVEAEALRLSVDESHAEPLIRRVAVHALQGRLTVAKLIFPVS